jgi:hypothetical protein
MKMKIGHWFMNIQENMKKKIVFLFGPVKASAILDQMFSKYFVSLRITDSIKPEGHQSTEIKHKLS